MILKADAGAGMLVGAIVPVFCATAGRMGDFVIVAPFRRFLPVAADALAVDLVCLFPRGCAPRGENDPSEREAAWDAIRSPVKTGPSSSEPSMGSS